MPVSAPSYCNALPRAPSGVLIASIGVGARAGAGRTGEPPPPTVLPDAVVRLSERPLAQRPAATSASRTAAT
jgi:hypothetical protein